MRLSETEVNHINILSVFTNNYINLINRKDTNVKDKQRKQKIKNGEDQDERDQDQLIKYNKVK